MIVARRYATRGWALALALSAGCAQVQPAPDFERARSLVEESTGMRDVFDPSTAPLDDAQLEAFLDGGLTLDEALRVALTHNRELQADFQQIGIAHADWVQSRLLSNPSLDVLLRFPSGGGRTQLEGIVGIQLLELWRMPARTRAAGHNVEATVLRIARRAGELLGDTRNAYYAAVAADELLQVATENVELARRSFDAVRALHAAGAADAFDENLAQGPLLTAQLARRTTQIDAANARRALAKQLSLDRSVEGLSLTDALPEPAPNEVDAEDLVQRALVSRLDLRALDAAILELGARVDLERRKAWGDAAAGPSVERQAVSGADLVGPALSLSLPVFDQNQAQVARATYQLEQMIQLQEAARASVAQDVRTSADRVNNASRNLTFYSRELLPQAERSLALARESYDAGRTTLLALVEVQRQLLDARRGYVTLRLEAATSASDLERVVGAPLVPPAPVR